MARTLMIPALLAALALAGCDNGAPAPAPVDPNAPQKLPPYPSSTPGAAAKPAEPAKDAGAKPAEPAKDAGTKPAEPAKDAGKGGA